MNPDAAGALIIGALITLMLVGLGVMLSLGKGAGLIAGYNTMDEARKSQIDEKALCRYVGRLLLVSTVFFAAVFLGVALGIEWMIFAGIAAFIAVIAAGVIYLNTRGKRKISK